MENMVRMLSFLIPSRFGEDAELVSELLYSVTNLLGMYNNHVLSTAAESDDAGAAAGRRVSSVLDKVQWGLTAVANLDVVAEMLSYRLLGSRGKWNVILAIEVARALAKIYVLLNGDGDRLIGGGAKEPPQYNAGAGANGTGADGGKDGNKGAEEKTPEQAMLDMMMGAEEEDAAPEPEVRWWRGKRSGVRIPLPPDFPAHVDSGSADKEERRLRLAGEVLHILRPTVYALARRLTGRWSWLPFILSVGCDYASHVCSQRADAFREPEPAPPLEVGNKLLRVVMWLATPHAGLSEAAAAEMSRRRTQWAFYLLRSPLFETVVRAGVDRAVDASAWVPLFGMLLRYCRDMLLYFQKHHFYVSAST